MVVTSSLGLSPTNPLPQTTTTTSNYPFLHNPNPTNSFSTFNFTRFLSYKRSFNNNHRNSHLGCLCNFSDEHNIVHSHSNTSSTSSNSSGSCEWDWNRWNRHFSEIEQAESYSSVLKFQLEEAVQREDFQEASKLKSALAEATSKDDVAKIMSELEKAIDDERYLDASKLSKSTGSGLVGWWVGCAMDSEDPFGRLVCITPGVGKFIGRSYTPRQLVTSSPGMTLFEIYVVKNADGAYRMQVVYLQRSKGSLTSSANLLPKPARGPPNAESEDPSVVGIQNKKEMAEKQEEKVLNVEGATEEGIKSVINFLKDKIPGLNVKIMSIGVKEEIIEESDSVKQMAGEDSGETDVDSEDDVDNIDEVENKTERLKTEGDSDSIEEDGKGSDMKVFIGGVVQNDEVSSKEDYIRLPAEIKDAEKDSFLLHIPGIHGTVESTSPDYKVAGLAGVSELMPSDIAKAFLGGNKISAKISKDVREIVKLAVSQALKKNTLSKHTRFSRITVPRGNFDPFDGLYVGAFGPYGTEIVQLRRKYGNWNNDNELNEASSVEFFEYVEAVKLTGDLNVPAGQVTFRAKIGKASTVSNRGMYPDELGVVANYKGQGRLAEFGFKNPKWVEGELLRLNGKGIGPYVRGADLGFLYIVPEQSFLVLFNRLELPE